MTRRTVLRMLACVLPLAGAASRGDAASPAAGDGVVLRDGWILLERDR